LSKVNNQTYSFMFENQKDVNYAKNLLKVYKMMVREFILKNQNVLNKYSEPFNRFIFLGGELSTGNGGKTLHNTKKSLSVHVHHPQQSDFQYVDYNRAFLSHFKSETITDQFFREFSRKTSIKNLALDLNYFYCFYRDVLKRFTSIDILLD
jgi:hypothetical protein